MNWGRVGRCPNCKQVWAVGSGDWEGGPVPKCPDCGSALIKYVPHPSERAALIADHIARDCRKAHGRPRRPTGRNPKG